jgi:hypothetical protein
MLKLLRYEHAPGHIQEAGMPPLETVRVPNQSIGGYMPHFLLTFGDPRQPPFAAAIIEAPSMSQARMTAVVRRLAPGLPFGEGLKLSDEMMTLIPPKQIGRTLSDKDATQLILQLVELQRNPDHSEGSTASA